MIVKERKLYFSPRVKCVEIDNSEIIATSPSPNNVSFGGDNTDGPRTAESKGLFQLVGDDSDDDFNDW